LLSCDLNHQFLVDYFGAYIFRRQVQREKGHGKVVGVAYRRDISDVMDEFWKG